MLRSKTCGELRQSDQGVKVTLCGWVDSYRDHSGIFFVNLRDRYGVTQVVFSTQMKKEMFAFPFGWFFKALGGIPVDRKRKSSLTDKITKAMNRHRSYNICVTPEGTRKAVGEWKKGFYYIALKANVPIQLAYLDYAKREGGITKILVPSGNEEADFAEIMDYYKNVTPRHPHKFINGELKIEN